MRRRARVIDDGTRGGSAPAGEATVAGTNHDGGIAVVLIGLWAITWIGARYLDTKLLPWPKGLCRVAEPRLHQALVPFSPRAMRNPDFAQDFA
jgi:hypothetical protein